MKITRANVQDYAERSGLQPLQIDGVPDGFAWFKDIQTYVGGPYMDRQIVAFKPLAEWEKGMIMVPVLVVDIKQLTLERERQIKRLLDYYNQ